VNSDLDADLRSVLPDVATLTKREPHRLSRSRTPREEYAFERNPTTRPVFRPKGRHPKAPRSSSRGNPSGRKNLLEHEPRPQPRTTCLASDAPKREANPTRGARPKSLAQRPPLRTVGTRFHGEP
jgi:hypothetical protein